MDWRREIIYILLAIGVFLLFYFLPARERFLQGVSQGVLLLHDYAREHIIFCLIPAFFIAGAIEVFISDQSVMKFLGPQAPKTLAYLVASVSGTILAVCSCTILPLFAGIYKMGAGLGPAAAFLYSGPAINVLAIILTARVLGPDIGVARAAGAIIAGIVIGLSMSLIFKASDKKRLNDISSAVEQETGGETLRQTVLFMLTLMLILIFGTWGNGAGLWQKVFEIKWHLTSIMAGVLLIELYKFYKIQANYLLAVGIIVIFTALISRSPESAYLIGVICLSITLFKSGGKAREWFESSYMLARQILPILFLGVLFAGIFLGRPGGKEGIISASYVAGIVGGSSAAANFFASILGALMYFATLTEIPILQGLMHSGMGTGPALALLLAGPAVSLPNMLVIRSIMGTKKTLVYVTLVVVFASISGIIFGALSGQQIIPK